MSKEWEIELPFTLYREGDRVAICIPSNDVGNGWHKATIDAFEASVLSAKLGSLFHEITADAFANSS